MDLEWKKLYVDALMKRGIPKGEAMEIFEAGIGSHDYDSDPEMSASDELSYWPDS